MIAAVAIEGVGVKRGPRLLFTGLNARVVAGEALALTGPNGAGKTSLLRCVAGFIHPVEGAVQFEGAADAAEARREGIHWLGHQDGLKASRTAGEELCFQAGLLGAAPTQAQAAAERMGLSRQWHLPVRVLSAGQRRRLALARLIAAPRPLWLLDEPLAPLDQTSRALFAEIMSEHLAQGGLILAAVHDPLPGVCRDLAIGA
jgi:heme exporter protein A